MSFRFPLVPALVAFAGPLTVAGAMSVDDRLSEIKESLAFGKTSLYLRARYEQVDQDTPPGVAPAVTKDAEAYTTRFALGYETKPYYGFSVFGQLEGVFAMGDEHYNSGVNGHVIYPTVTDPKGAELNQAWAKYAPAYVPRTFVKAGRQEISLDNQRFVGPVGWRQDWQSFDAVLAQSSYVKDVTLTYAWLDRVYRVQGPANVAGESPLENSHLLNANWRLPDVVSVTGYGYWIDFDANAVAAPVTALRRQSTRTLGLRATGPYALDQDWGLVYAAEYAVQDDYGDNTDVSVDAHYALGELGVAWRSLALKAGYELMSGSGDLGDKFSTPLATLHAFDGWADLFLNTPDTGLVDRYVSLSGPLPIAIPWLDSFRIGIVYHRFASDVDAIAYGDEIDLQLEYALKKIDPGLVVGAKYADYRADDDEGALFAGTTQRNVDTTKTWVYVQYSF